MASSTDDHRHVSAPPSTPTTSHPHSSSSTATSTLLSNLLLRLPPTLSLSPPTRHRPTATTTPPSISLSSQSLSSFLLSAATELGFLQLTHHSVPPQLANLAESESLSLFPPKHPLPLQSWPAGFDDDHDSFCFDSASFTESTQSLSELTLELERVGKEVLKGMGFWNPEHDDPTRIHPLMWVSETGQGGKLDEPGRVYPYIIGLEYQIRCGKLSLLVDSGRVFVSPQVHSIFVTFGDIAQVWSNGKIKKVRGRPVPIISGEITNNINESAINCVSMTLLLTLPLESIVSPQIPQALKAIEGEEFDENGDEKIIFDSFSFEDYAWRVYHERLHLKDPLDRQNELLLFFLEVDKKLGEKIQRGK